MTNPEAPSPASQEGHDAQVILFPRIPGYAEAMTPHAVGTMLGLGLDHDFVPIYEEHLNDLHIAVHDDRGIQDAQPTSLTVTHRDAQEVKDGHAEWERELVISQKEIQTKAGWLLGQVKIHTGSNGDDEKAHNAALDWIYHIHSVAALGNAVYMQQRIGKYLPDFNGQSSCYRTEQTISIEYSRTTGREIGSFGDDTQSIMQGYGVHMLRESMLMHGLVDRASLATFITNGLRTQIQPRPFGVPAISRRIQSLVPVEDPLKMYEDFSALYIDSAGED